MNIKAFEEVIRTYKRPIEAKILHKSVERKCQVMAKIPTFDHRAVGLCGAVVEDAIESIYDECPYGESENVKEVSTK